MKCKECGGSELKLEIKKTNGDLSENTGEIICPICGVKYSKGTMLYHKTNPYTLLMYTSFPLHWRNTSRLKNDVIHASWIDKSGIYHNNDFYLFELEIA